MANFFKNLFNRNQGENNEREEKFKNKIDKKNFEIFKYDGLRAQRIGRIDYAVECFLRALEIDEDFETLNYLSQAYLQQDDLESACATFKRMIVLEPELQKTYLSLAHVYFMQEKYQEMTEVAMKAVAIEEKDEEAQFLVAKAHHRVKNASDALVALDKAINQRTDYIEARLLRAEIYLNMMDQVEKAQPDIDFIIQHSPDDEGALYLHGEAKEKTGHPDEAETAYRRVIELNPFHEKAYVSLGNLYTKHNREEEAQALLAEAQELNTNFDGKGQTNEPPKEETSSTGFPF